MGNSLEYQINLRDGFSSVASKITDSTKSVASGIDNLRKSASSSFSSIAQGAAMVGAAAFSMRGVVSDGLKVMTGDFSKLGNLFGALPGPIGVVGEAVGNALGGMIQRTIDATIAFDKLSQVTGASVEFLSGFTEAADDVRISSETVSASLTIFSKKLGGVDDVMDGSGQTAGAFAQKLKDLGITTDNMEEALFQVADVFQKMPNGVDKAALAVSLFGKQGAALIPILNKGREGIRGMMSNAKETGKVIDQDLRDKVVKLAEAQDKLNDSWGGLETRIGAELIPAFLNVTEGVNKYIVAVQKGNKETDIFKRFTAGLGASLDLFNSGALSDLNAGFAAFGAKVGSAARDVGGGGQLSAGVGSIGKAFGDLISPVKDSAGAMGDWSAAFSEVADRVASSIGPLRDFAAAATSAVAPALDLSNGVGQMPEKFDKARVATELFRLATGKVAFESWEAERANRAVTQALLDGQVTKEQAAKLWQDISQKTVPLTDILGNLGKAGRDASKDIDLMRDALGRVQSKDVSLTFNAQETTNYQTALRQYFQANDKTVTVRFQTVAGTDVETDTGGNARARGGPVKRNRPYLVGEQGPEMFVPYASGYIVPNSQTPYTDPGTKVNQSFNVNNPSIIINSANGAAIAQQIARQNLNVARRARARASLTG